MDTSLQYPVAHLDVTLEDASVVNYLKTLLKQMKGVRKVTVKTTIPKVTMTEQEFYAKIDRSLESVEQGAPTFRMEANESAIDFLDRITAVV